MEEDSQSVGEELPEFAHHWLAQRRLASARLAEMRLQELRQLTEAEAARIFEKLDPPRPYELRPSSGLVEQQRWFRLLLDSLTAGDAEQLTIVRDE